MEDLHRTHKEVPFGYWTQWVEPAIRFLTRRWRDRHAERAPPSALDQLSAPH